MPRATRKTSKALSRKKEKEEDITKGTGKQSTFHKILTAEGWKRLMMKRSGKSQKSK